MSRMMLFDNVATNCPQDLEEVWKLLGISGCPQCLCPDPDMGNFAVTSPLRSFTVMREIIRTSRGLLLERGNVTAVTQLLQENRLSSVHMKMCNPFLLLPHADVECFPQDHLHGM